MRIFFSVGEPSGDLHGSNLIRQLQADCPDVECVGFGGPKMAAAGCQLHADLTQLAMVGLFKVLANIPRFWKLAQLAEETFRMNPPDAVVLIDYPGFNWHVARLAQKYDIPVFYYGAPQIWAWASWRINKMRRYVDHVLCKLPFETKWYQQQGCRATYVGHPYFDEMTSLKFDESFLSEQRRRLGKLVTILPGSRTQEVNGNLKWFLKAASKVAEELPTVRFAIASYNERQARVARKLVEDSQLPIDVYVGRTQELIHLADCCLACSGSVSLELLYHEKPTVIHYHISPLVYFLQLFLRNVKYITLVNLLASDELNPRDLKPYSPDQPDADSIPMPEYWTVGDRTNSLAMHLTTWLTKPEEHAHTVNLLREIKAEVGQPGASRRAAEYILKELTPPTILVRPLPPEVDRGQRVA